MSKFSPENPKQFEPGKEVQPVSPESVTPFMLVRMLRSLPKISVPQHVRDRLRFSLRRLGY